MKDGGTFILASNSPRRRALLSTILPTFRILPSHIDEDQISATPRRTALVLAREKARAVAEQCLSGTLIAADTVIDLEHTVLGKPLDGEHAFEMLRMMSGKTHEVVTGLCIVNLDKSLRVESIVATRVQMRPYGTTEIREYIATGEPLDKAGAYAIQGKGSGLISAVEGCYNNVVGLPLCEVTRLLLGLDPRSALGRATCHLPDGSQCPRLANKSSWKPPQVFKGSRNVRRG